jgi:hypothetical protein
MIPERLATALADRYRIEHELGAGGMATLSAAESRPKGLPHAGSRVALPKALGRGSADVAEATVAIGPPAAVPWRPSLRVASATSSGDDRGNHDV